MVAPAVEDFVFKRALRMPAREFLVGATGAAIAVNGAITRALRKDGSLLEDLRLADALTPPLYSALHREVLHVQAGGEQQFRDTLNRLDREHEKLLMSEPELIGTLLVIGAQRDHFPHHGQHQLAVGSALVVSDGSGERLWSPTKQTELLESNGCSVQVTVSFGGAREGEELYTFEAALDGDAIMNEECADEDLRIALADFNGRIPDRNAFWASTSEDRSVSD